MTTRDYRGNSHSYNGWPFITVAGTVRAVVPGTEDVRIEIRRGEVATVLNAWAALWHRRIRRIDTYRPRDYWGWSAENDHPTSCHLSGTAIDLNATALPFNSRTMPAEQRTAVDQLANAAAAAVADPRNSTLASTKTETSLNVPSLWLSNGEGWPPATTNSR